MRSSLGGLSWIPLRDDGYHHVVDDVHVVTTVDVVDVFVDWRRRPVDDE
jgi:hypothetical protein